MTDPLRLHFNERPDRLTQIDKDMPFGQTLWRYPDRAPLEARVAELHKLKPEQVLCSNGGDEAIMILMRILFEAKVNGGMQMILPLPAFSQYTWGIESWQLEPTIIAAKDDLQIDPNEVLATLDNYAVVSNAKISNPAAVVILTSPNNPTGQQLADEELEKIIAKAAKRNVWVFLDEAYIEFSSRGSNSRLWLDDYSNLIVLKTLSKAYGMAGIRLGYILGDECIIAEFSRRCAPFNLPTPSIEIALQALEPEISADVVQYCQKIQSNRTELADWLKNSGIPVLAGEANFLMLPIGDTRATMVARFLSRNNILVRQFSGELAHCIRITVPYDIEKLSALLKQVFQPELICLDMDGVLIDTSDSYDTTVLATVAKLSNKTVTLEHVTQKRNQGGYNNDWVLTQALLAELGYDCDLQTVTDAFQRLYLGDDETPGFATNETPLIQASLETRIKRFNKPNWGIVTGRPLQEAKAGQKMVGLAELPLISMDCAPAKPKPDGIQKLQKALGRDSWMCGDNPDDIEAAHRSGSVAIGIRATDQQALYDAGADVVLASVNELENWL